MPPQDDTRKRLLKQKDSKYSRPEMYLSVGPKPVFYKDHSVLLSTANAKIVIEYVNHTGEQR